MTAEEGKVATPRPPQAGDGPWSRVDRVLLALLVVGAVASSFALVHPWYDPENDGSIYIATARSLIAGSAMSARKRKRPFRPSRSSQRNPGPT